ncbi:glycosyltransferase family 4 protein [Eisenbergiella tayi]|uniref:Glycosyltransferase family 4 protein n=1 Tax=Eisenbergiella porci TaxID=2652274 RepID=A0A6N7VV48_9FIRM|nr:MULTISPECIES: glycosyltransferase [Eisenbergiella]MSS86921.1 glycosyltransferase family 4 protein [Eisenbergiella porci]
MKIAFISANLETGGIERVVNNLSNYLTQDGHEVHIIATKDGRCNYFVDKDVVLHVLYHDKNKNRAGRVLKKVKEFRKIIRHEKYDVMLSFGSYVTIYTVVASAFMNARIIGSERTDPSVAPESAVVRKIRDIAYRFATGMVFQTEDARAYFCKSIQKKGSIIPNPIKENLPERWEGIREKEIVNFCRLNRQKNLTLLIRAFANFHASHSNYKLIIYGEGELKDSLIQLAKELNIKEYMEIRSFTVNIHECILKSAMFVSSSDYEGISNSMIESMGIGLPCICTDCPVGGARMMIMDKENGLLTPVGDEHALAEAMSYIADNPDEAERIGKQAVKIRERLSVDKIVSLWINKINEIVTHMGVEE